jgi:PAS domain S-box-containing protein
VRKAPEETFDKAFRASPIAIAISSLEEDRYLEANEAFSRLVGYDREETMGRTAAELEFWADPRERDRLIASLKEKGPVRDREIHFRRKSGEVGVALMAAEIIELCGGRYLLAFIRDITQRKRREEALRRVVQAPSASTGERFFQLLVRHLTEALGADYCFVGELQDGAPEHVKTIAVWSPEGPAENFVYTLAGTPCAHVVGREPCFFSHDLARRFPSDRMLADLRIAGYAGTPLFDSSGAALGLVVVLYRQPPGDPELARSLLQLSALRAAAELERLRGEEALRRSEQKFRSLFEQAPYGIFRSTLTGRMVAVNPALMELLGYQSEEHLLKLNVAQDLHRDAEEGAEFLRRCRALAPFRDWEVSWRRKDGASVAVRLSGRPVQDEENCFELIAEDVSERHALGEQLRQSLKMEAIGRLAGGVAHDFNNLLTAILGYSELLTIRLGEDHRLAGSVKEIRKAAERAAALTRQLLAFSRKQVLQPKLVDLNSIVSEVAQMLHRLIGEDVALVTLLDPTLARVKADPGQIEQVILNLAINARDAMPHGGRLTLETANAQFDERQAQPYAGLQPGKYALLIVSDTGVGMDEKTLPRIFEPFFTTKDTGQGTGLGLSTVYGIVKQSGGYIWVTSTPGRGATFKVGLPWAAEPSAEHRPEPVPTELDRRTETVLLVEDEDALRELVTDFLKSMGYSVLAARDGYDALEIAKRATGPIHVLLTDVIMPGMSGFDLSRRFAITHPTLKVVFMSGYSEEAIAQHGTVGPGSSFLQKPFSRAGLARKLSEVLDETRRVGV